MAIMIPEKPKEIVKASREDVMFEELEKLPNDYYVFHSFSMTTVKNNTIYESETDFVVFHPKKGIICIEAKAGAVDYNSGNWVYGSGKIMSHDGPFNQASTNKWKLITYVKDHGLSGLLDHCKFLHAVWFPDVSKSKFAEKKLPSEADLNLMLTEDSFGKVEEDIESIFSIELPNRVQTVLTKKEIDQMLNRVLAPSFNLVSLEEVTLKRKHLVFKKMLDEQIALLNYLEEQRDAIINGLAGTGKTVLALEKAKRHSDKGEKVLFLCYNSFLKQHLKETYKFDNVSYYTIDGFACKICDSNEADYEQLSMKLLEMQEEGTFPYDHVIIDEGQDFGKNEIDEVEIIELLKSNVLDDDSNVGSFYIFYDKNQMIQSSKIPSYISEADCKLTLYRNCRNTKNIAKTSLRLLGSDKQPKLFNNIDGDNPEMLYEKDKEKTIILLDKILNRYIDEGYNDITILTCKTEETSIISERCVGGKYLGEKGKVKFTTCRKFKGLESEVVILLDVDKDSFDDLGEQIMYVGTSRAKFGLTCIINMDDDDCIKVLERINARYNRNIKKSFATAFNAKYVSEM